MRVDREFYVTTSDVECGCKKTEIAAFLFLLTDKDATGDSTADRHLSLRVGDSSRELQPTDARELGAALQSFADDYERAGC